MLPSLSNHTGWAESKDIVPQTAWPYIMKGFINCNQNLEFHLEAFTSS